MQIIHEKLGDEERCPYLKAERSQLLYRVIRDCSADSYQQMLELGWRRFGLIFFRPQCQRCAACRSLRIDVQGFRPNRSMRRTLERNRDLEVFLERPSMSETHLELYARYQADMVDRRGWDEKHASAEDYYLNFVEGQQDFGYELLYLEQQRLVGVALVDILPRAISAVYCYYDPSARQRGIGVFSVLKQIELARALKRPHVYLGYLVARNPSMRYKASYRPHEILEGRPDFAEQPVWIRQPENAVLRGSRG